MTFKFKQFTIDDNNCGMSLSSDAVLLGAWAPINNNSILDIGTGCGILSLMAAQRSNAYIHAIEINTNAYNTAVKNFNSSPFAQRLQAINVDLNIWQISSKYQTIICNPPFFSRGVIAKKDNKAIAKHQQTLTFAQLLAKSEALLEEDGNLCLILPSSELDTFKLALNNSLFYLKKLIKVYPNLDNKANRVLMELTFQPCTTVISELYIRIGDEYHPNYKLLVKDFYLKF